jgi:YggT family protein
MGAAFLVTFVRFLLIAFEVAVLGRVLLSWVDPRGRSSLGQLLISVTEPVLAPIRRLLPPTGMLDLAPLILLLILGAVVRSLP